MDTARPAVSSCLHLRVRYSSQWHNVVHCLMSFLLLVLRNRIPDHSLPKCGAHLSGACHTVQELLCFSEEDPEQCPRCAAWSFTYLSFQCHCPYQGHEVITITQMRKTEQQAGPLVPSYRTETLQATRDLAGCSAALHPNPQHNRSILLLQARDGPCHKLLLSSSKGAHQQELEA